MYDASFDPLKMAQKKITETVVKSLLKLLLGLRWMKGLFLGQVSDIMITDYEKCHFFKFFWCTHFHVKEMSLSFDILVWLNSNIESFTVKMSVF